MSKFESNTFSPLTPVYSTVSTVSILSESHEKGRTSTKCDIKDEFLWLEEFWNVATRGRPVADRSTKSGRVNCSVVA